MPSSVVELVDVPGAKAKLMLPVPLRVGDKINLLFRLQRQHNGRSEVLDVTGDFRVSSVQHTATHQLLQVESLGKAPAWRAVKKQAARQLGPATFPPTKVQ